MCEYVTFPDSFEEENVSHLYTRSQSIFDSGYSKMSLFLYAA